MKTEVKTKIEKLVVDESVSTAQLSACQKWLKNHSAHYQQLYFIADHHPGMPDSRILKSALNKHDAMLTTDRPFHNRLLEEGITSFYINNTLTITQHAIQGIRPAFLPEPNGDDDKQPEMSSLHNLIMPDSDKVLKKLRTKRRRIRSHFGGYDQLNQLSITLATHEELIGIRLHVAGGSAKGIVATESYIAQPDKETGKAALCHALVLALQLMLQRLPVSLFYDPATIPDPYSLDDQFFNRLKNEFPTVKFIACSKGQHMNALWEKLSTLKSTNNNEIVGSRLLLIKQRVEQRTDQFLRTPAEHKGMATAPTSLPSSNTDRGALLLAAKWFFDKAIKLQSITRIALIGSICTEKKHPKDIDILLTIAPGADIAPISKLKRQMCGRIQRGLLGSDIFLMEEERYIGRPCRFREPHPRVACAQDGLRCDFDKPFLCDTSCSFELKNDLINSPPITLYPKFQARVNVPADVQIVFDLIQDNKEVEEVGTPIT